MGGKKSKRKKDIWYKIASFIIDQRRIITILFLVAAVYGAFCINKVTVNQDITSYLPEESETRKGLLLMEEEFTTPGVAQVMISNVTYDEAAALAKKIEKVEGVSMVQFDNSASSYRGTNALLAVTTEGAAEDEISIAAKAEIKELLSDYDAYISSQIGYIGETQEMLTREMTGILVWAVIIIVGVLLISAKAFMLIPILFITFGTAAVLNMGTNYWYGEVSFVSNAIAIVLQLALSIDYAIILSDRFMEEHEHMEVIPAAKTALSKAIPEISSSSLTTISGMVAMMLMQFKLGYDMGIVLVKSILFSLICVFLFMPGLLVFFAKQIDQSHHKSLVPDVSIIGRYAIKTKKVIPPIFLVMLILGFIGTLYCPFLYDMNTASSGKADDATVAREHIVAAFGTSNQLVVMVPKGDYESEKKALAQMADVEGVSYVMGMANQEIMEGTVLTDKMSPRQFAELTDLDLELIEGLYALYAYDQENYAPLVTDIDNYGVPMIDMFMFLYDKYEEGYFTLGEEMDQMLTELFDMLDQAQTQLVGENHVRFILNLDMPTEGEETYAVMDEIRGIAASYYGEENVTLVGDSTSNRDLEISFATDNIVISVMTALFVFIVLIFTFQSVGLPLILVLTIQGSIWISFAIPTVMQTGVYFIGYLIVSAIQMGATIDYAIVIGNRYMQLKKTEPKEIAIQHAINQAFPTVFTSGTIMAAAGMLVGYMTSNVTISVFGVAMGRGATISVLMVLLVLPQLMLFCDKFIEKTRFKISLVGKQLTKKEDAEEKKAEEWKEDSREKKSEGRKEVSRDKKSGESKEGSREKKSEEQKKDSEDKKKNRKKENPAEKKEKKGGADHEKA